MKKLVYLALGASLLLASCDDLLDTTNYTQKTTGNFPTNVNDAEQMLTGVYQNLNLVSANPQMSFMYLSMLASDDNLGGGGTNDKLMQALDLIGNYQSDMTRQFWQDRYAGIARANSFISVIDNTPGMSDEQRAQMKGEALTLRAYYYYELASQYGNIPLIVTPEAVDAPNAAPSQTWGQILLDLKTAADIMPAGQTQVNGKLQAGKIDKYVAEGLLGRAWLFYTGMYGNGEKLTDLVSPTYNPLTEVTLPDGSKLTKDDVISYIDDCVNNSGYKLVSDFRNLWAYTNRTTVNDFSYTKGKGLKWAEDDNAVNPESMFAIKFNKLASWSSTIGFANGYALHFGVRGGQDYANTFPFGQGWGAGPVAPNLVNDWKAAEPNDMRRDASVYNVNNMPKYTKGGWADFVQETDFIQMKNIPISAKNTTSSDPAYYACFENVMYGTENWTQGANNMQLNNIHDMVLMRFAEVLLMQSELKENVDGINKVRARAGLPALASYSLAALQKERRWELAFEGIRWNDIRRWHIAAAALSKQTDTPVYYTGQPSTNKAQLGGYAARYNATAGFFKIPESQVSLSQSLKQNEGWGADAEYNGWTK